MAIETITPNPIMNGNKAYFLCRSWTSANMLMIKDIASKGAHTKMPNTVKIIPEALGAAEHCCVKLCPQAVAKLIIIISPISMNPTASK